MKVIVVDDGRICADLFELIKSTFEVEAVRNPYQVLETLRTSMGGFDVVISYVHYKRQKDINQLHKIIAQEFPQLPIVCSKCISAAVKCVDEEEGIMSASDLINKWQLNTENNECMMDWTEELNFKFFAVVESLGGTESKHATPTNILEHMINDAPELTTKKISSHLQKFRNSQTEGPHRNNKIARDYENYQNYCIQQIRQLEASSSYNSHPAAFDDIKISGSEKCVLHAIEGYLMSDDYSSYSIQVGQQQFPVPPLSPESDIFKYLDPITKLPTLNDSSGGHGNHMVDFSNNFDSEINIVEWPDPTGNWQ